MTPIDRDDLESLKDWVRAEFRVIEAQLKAQDEALKVAYDERTKKDAELNDVRLRFIPREVFDRYVEQQASQRRALVVALAFMALTIIGLVLQVTARA